MNRRYWTGAARMGSGGQGTPKHNPWSERQPSDRAFRKLNVDSDESPALDVGGSDLGWPGQGVETTTVAVAAHTRH